MAVDTFTYLRQIGFSGTLAQMAEQLRRDTTKKWHYDVPLEELTDGIEKILSSTGTLAKDNLVAAPTGISSIDTGNIQRMIDSVAAGNGGSVNLQAGVYLIDTTLTLPSGIHLRGTGIGGDIFSIPDTSGNLPFKGTALKLKASSNCDMIKTAGFDALTGTSTGGPTIPHRFGIHDMVIDGNKYSNTAGIPLKIYGRTYQIENVTVQNGAGGGVYSEYRTGGYEMEAKWSSWTVTDCGLVSFDWRGPHDSMFINGTVGHPHSTATHGIKLSGNVGGEQFTNTHVWGAFATHAWEIGTANGYFTNCTSDGQGICLTGSGNTWDGTIYGINVPGQYAVKIGDTATRTIGQNTVRGRVFNFVASPYAVQTLTTTNTGNRFQATADLAGAVLLAKGLPTTLSSAAVTSDTTLNVVSTANLPASGTVRADDGTHGTSALGYSGKTLTTLTGVTGIPAAGLASGAAVYLESLRYGSDDFGGDSFEVFDYENNTSFGLWHVRSTPNANSNHNSIMRVAGRIFADEGMIIADSGGHIGSNLKSGTGAPSYSATAGDLWFRTDTPSTANQRIYICTGTTNWTGIA